MDFIGMIRATVKAEQVLNVDERLNSAHIAAHVSDTIGAAEDTYLAEETIINLHSTHAHTSRLQRILSALRVPQRAYTYSCL